VVETVEENDDEWHCYSNRCILKPRIVVMLWWGGYQQHRTQ
jgi:hypothetical protein